MVKTRVVASRHAVLVSEPAEPEIPERATRRVFSAQYKLRILAEYERPRSRRSRRSPPTRGVVHIIRSPNGRKQRDQGALQALGAAPGRPPTDPREHELARLRRENARLHSDLAKAHRVIEVQGKLRALLELLATGSVDPTGGEPK